MRPSTRILLTAVFATGCIAGSSVAADADKDKDIRVGVLETKSSHSYGRSGGHHTPPSRGDHRDRHDGRHRPSGHGYDRGHGGHGRDYGHHDHRGHRRDYGHHDHRGYYPHPRWGRSYTRHYYAPPAWRHHGPYSKHKGYYCEHCHYRSSSYTIFYQHVFRHHHVPWYEIAGLIVFDPVRLYFVYGGHG